MQQALAPRLEVAHAAAVLAQARRQRVQQAGGAVAQRLHQEGGVAQVGHVCFVRDQRVGRQRVLGPHLEVGPGGGQGGAAERVAVLLQQQGGHLLQQHGVVALKGLEDVVVAAQGAQPVHLQQPGQRGTHLSSWPA
jgi:hypothetical protein